MRRVVDLKRVEVVHLSESESCGVVVVVVACFLLVCKDFIMIVVMSKESKSGRERNAMGLD